MSVDVLAVASLGRQVQRLLLLIYPQTCCCEDVINTAHIWKPPFVAYMNHLVEDLYRLSWERWRVSEACCNCYSNHLLYTIIWMLSSKLIGCWYKKTTIKNNNCTIWSCYSLCQIELDLSDCTIKSFMENLWINVITCKNFWLISLTHKNSLYWSVSQSNLFMLMWRSTWVCDLSVKICLLMPAGLETWAAVSI